MIFDICIPNSLRARGLSEPEAAFGNPHLVGSGEIERGGRVVNSGDTPLSTVMIGEEDYIRGEI